MERGKGKGESRKTAVDTIHLKRTNDSLKKIETLHGVYRVSNIIRRYNLLGGEPGL